MYHLFVSSYYSHIVYVIDPNFTLTFHLNDFEVKHMRTTDFR